jgi:RNA polymerase sigma-70 factor (ECF subfamily)
LKSPNSEIAILLQKCKENNQKAQLALYNMYCSAMFNVAFRIVSNKTLAEEIMQDSFLKAFTKLDSYSGKVTFGAWLKKIVINTSINELKKANQFQFESLNDGNEFEDINENDIISSSYPGIIPVPLCQSDISFTTTFISKLDSSNFLKNFLA